MHWKEILPSNRYIAYMSYNWNTSDHEVLTLLYQPLIGSLAYSLYMTLSLDVQRQPSKKVERTHKTLMTSTGQHLDHIFSERKKLEAIGLLSVYREKIEGEFVYYYHLHPPMDASGFFNDDLLSVFLYNKLGSKEQYRELRQYFSVEEVNTGDLENVTQGFNQVFTSIHPSEMRSTTPDMLEMLSSSSPLAGRKASDSHYNFAEDGFDFQQFISYLPSFIPKAEIENTKNQRLIYQLAFMYKLKPEEMAHLIQDAMLHSEKLDADQLRIQAKRRYRMNEQDEPPRLGLRIQPEELKSQAGPPQTQEDKTIQYFETTAPIEYLEELSDGARVYEGDIDIIERLIFEYKLSPGVVNVLLDYIFMVNDKKLSKALAFKIAGHWKRKKIKTVKEAMSLAKKENQKRQTFQEKGDRPSYQKKSSSSAQVRKEPLPKWMTDNNWKKEEASEQELEKAKKEAAKYREMLRKKKQQKEES
ncbi:replication initiation and membrane attachment family protein [Salipaludibacillus aurantiacus]|uniref:Replicative DNA helicase loader DnaB n=1 Tax=Salipaludibacillus aurantiacus TaxID=1601833 RepID=A0A1H9T011_9BACI|nr:DnaD domain protein [Salipaludibacillus aurantiacus]SER89963.1 replicative DNA helicase loader DnaB [Salipaludibacillus aurantiacus]